MCPAPAPGGCGAWGGKGPCDTAVRQAACSRPCDRSGTRPCRRRYRGERRRCRLCRRCGACCSSAPRARRRAWRRMPVRLRCAGAHQAQFRFESHEATINRSYWQQVARFARGLMVGAQPSTWIWHSTASVRQRRSGGTVAGERGGRRAPVARSWCTALTASTFHVSSCLNKGRIKRRGRGPLEAVEGGGKGGGSTVAFAGGICSCSPADSPPGCANNKEIRKVIDL